MCTEHSLHVSPLTQTHPFAAPGGSAQCCHHPTSQMEGGRRWCRRSVAACTRAGPETSPRDRALVLGAEAEPSGLHLHAAYRALPPGPLRPHGPRPQHGCVRGAVRGRGPQLSSTGSSRHGQGATHSPVQSGPSPSWQPWGCVWGQRAGPSGDHGSPLLPDKLYRSLRRTWEQYQVEGKKSQQGVPGRGPREPRGKAST